MASALRAKVNCYDCRVACYEGGQLAPCDPETRHPATKVLGHHCKYGLVVPVAENVDALRAFHTLQVFGPEAGMRLLEAKLGRESLVRLSGKLEDAMAELNKYQHSKVPKGEG